MTEKIMQPIFFVELCSQITSRVVFRSYKPICTFIWMPSKYTQMSLNPNHYLEPCRLLQSSQGLVNGLKLKKNWLNWLE